MKTKNMLLNNQWVNEKKQRGNQKKNLKTNENGNTTLQDLWDAAKVVVRGKFTMIQAYLNKQEKFQINNLALPKGTRKRRTNKCKISRRKKIIKIRDKTSRSLYLELMTIDRKSTRLNSSH